MDYNRPRTGMRRFSAGVLTGGVLSMDGAVEKLQSNLSFRIQSARSMLVGSSSVAPLDRRQQIRERRLELLGMGSSEEDTSDTRQNNNSGNITESSTRQRNDTSRSVKSSTPSMSEVNAGTRQRAIDRGFDG